MKAFLPSILLLAALIVFPLWSGRAVAQDLDICIQQLDAAREQVRRECWEEAVPLLRDSYQLWQEKQTYLHILTHHDVLDETEILYQRVAAFAESADTEEFLVETAGLCSRLRLMAEAEQLVIGNIM